MKIFISVNSSRYFIVSWGTSVLWNDIPNGDPKCKISNSYMSNAVFVLQKIAKPPKK